MAPHSRLSRGSHSCVDPGLSGVFMTTLVGCSAEVVQSSRCFRYVEYLLAKVLTDDITFVVLLFKVHGGICCESCGQRPELEQNAENDCI